MYCLAIKIKIGTSTSISLLSYVGRRYLEKGLLYKPGEKENTKSNEMIGVLDHDSAL